MKKLFSGVSETPKVWLLPIFLFLIIVVLLVLAERRTPPPTFIYPIL